MRLILCPQCRDTLKLIFRPRTCACGKSSGYCDEHGVAHFAGPAIPMEISDHSLKSGLAHPSTNGSPTRVIAWLVPSTEIEKPYLERQWHGNAPKRRKGKSRRPRSKHCEPAGPHGRRNRRERT